MEYKGRKGLPVSTFATGQKAVLANPYLTVKSANEIDDTFTIVDTQLSFGAWKGAINDRTGYGYVMADGEYALLVN